MYNYDFEKQDFESCYGTVTGNFPNGSYLLLDNGEMAIANHKSKLLEGNQVVCKLAGMSGEYRFVYLAEDVMLDRMIVQKPKEVTVKPETYVVHSTPRVAPRVLRRRPMRVMEMNY